jgi:hypothetical protein
MQGKEKQIRVLYSEEYKGYQNKKTYLVRELKKIIQPLVTRSVVSNSEQQETIKTELGIVRIIVRPTHALSLSEDNIPREISSIVDDLLYVLLRNKSRTITIDRLGRGLSGEIEYLISSDNRKSSIETRVSIKNNKQENDDTRLVISIDGQWSANNFKQLFVSLSQVYEYYSVQEFIKEYIQDFRPNEELVSAGATRRDLWKRLLTYIIREHSFYQDTLNVLQIKYSSPGNTIVSGIPNAIDKTGGFIRNIVEARQNYKDSLSISKKRELENALLKEEVEGKVADNKHSMVMDNLEEQKAFREEVEAWVKLGYTIGDACKVVRQGLLGAAAEQNNLLDEGKIVSVETLN